jgi:glucose/arabinose dehydrogenase
VAGVWALKDVSGTLTWVLESEFMRQTPMEYDMFGEAIAVSPDGYLVIGSSTKLIRTVR